MSYIERTRCCHFQSDQRRNSFTGNTGKTSTRQGGVQAGFLGCIDTVDKNQEVHTTTTVPPSSGGVGAVTGVVYYTLLLPVILRDKNQEVHTTTTVLPSPGGVGAVTGVAYYTLLLPVILRGQKSRGTHHDHSSTLSRGCRSSHRLASSLAGALSPVNHRGVAYYTLLNCGTCHNHGTKSKRNAPRPQFHPLQGV